MQQAECGSTRQHATLRQQVTSLYSVHSEWLAALAPAAGPILILLTTFW